MKAPILRCAMLLTLSFGALSAVYGGSATWSANPATNDWNTATNWMPPTIPNGSTDTATFDASSITAVSLSADIEIDSILFDPGASAFTVTIPTSLTLSISGIGLTNNSATRQNLVTEPTVTNEPGTIQFSQNASAGGLVSITNNGGIGGGIGGVTSFIGSATAATATIINNGSSVNTAAGGRTQFFEQSSAGEGTFIMKGGTSPLAPGGKVEFHDDSSAGAGNFTVNGGTRESRQGGVLLFFDNSAAGDATVTAYPGGNNSIGSGAGIGFFNDSSAAHATIILNGATAPGIAAGVGFLDSSTPADATLIANGGIGGMGSVISLAANGGAARIEVFGNAFLYAGFVAPGLTTGSIEGDGRISMGPYNIAVGVNNLSTTFSGVMQESDPHEPGSFTKIGNGILTLTGANSYTGGTTLSAGGLVVGNTIGSATGAGPVQTNGGTLGGSGIIAGAVTIGTGSGAGAFLEPSVGVVKPSSLSIQSALTFKADSTYTYNLNTKRAKADKVIANGVTIDSGAQFNFVAAANKTLNLGKVFVAISNTSATPIIGTFSNLPEGATITAGANTYQASYEGGDGNDLTLTVVP